MPRQKKTKIIVILGQTATGKSTLAVRLAKKFNGEIISADSRQVYRGLDLGTGKITKREMRGVPHYLLDVVNPGSQFSVAEYKKLADHAIADILSRGKISIICGGTGLYIDNLVNGMVFPEVPPNESLRKKLNRKTAKQLFVILKKLDARRAGEIDKNNPRRLIRAIEIARALGRVPRYTLRANPYLLLKIGLKLPNEILRRKIHIRLMERISAKGGSASGGSQGMISEVKRLNKQGLSWKRLEALGLEYRYLAKYLQGKMSKEEAVKKLETEIWRYAKRQNTWFKRDKNIIWLDASKKGFVGEANELVKKFLRVDNSA